MASSSIGRNSSWSRRLEHYSCLIFFLGFLVQILLVSSDTYSRDAAALNSLANLWENTPSNWKGSDPCGDNWVGITCNNARITQILLSSLGLKGTLSGDLTSLTELQVLVIKLQNIVTNMDLSYNKGFTGGLPASIASLTNLLNLILVGCSFSGEIPPQIGSLSRLVFLSLNSNKFTGNIPSTIGNLSNLYWLDLADNQLTGTIPVNPGLDSLTHTLHFHFGINQLSGTIPRNLFSSNMRLIHLLLDNNKLTGSIPSTLGLVNTLEVLRLDNNSLSGPVPSNINNLTKVAEFHLANNLLTGPLPNLTGMSLLNFVDMSNNSFDESDVPPWFSTLPSLTSLYLEFLKIAGPIPPALFSNSPLQIVKLKHNRFNGTLNVSTGYSSQLEMIDLQDNDISAVLLGVGGYSEDIILVGNPFCDQGGNVLYCKVQQQSPTPYSTPQNCVRFPCPSDMSLSPNCYCAYPYTGTLYFRAPSYSNLQNVTYYQILEQALKAKFLSGNIPVDSVSLNNSFVNSDNNLQMDLQVFPGGKSRFNEREVTLLGFTLSNQTFKPISIFGPFYFIGQHYVADSVIAPSKNSSHLPVIAGAAAGAAGLVLVLIGCAVFVIARRRKVKKTVHTKQTSGPWDLTKSSSGSMPQLKGARYFSFNEVKKFTNNFSQANEIGNGGYGMVYKGILPNGQLVAIKRAQEDSAQGVTEFNTEVELLSRVHHKNLVSLVGFCFDQGEQILVYDYVPNGTLKESLLGKSGVRLDWRRRLNVALGAARGLTYLHELANPPIVHRDIKSSNILLDDNLNAKVSDFGLSKLLGEEKRGHISTQVKGTMGYLDPEYYMTQQLTEKSDVYSFGVLLLELLTAKRPIEHGRYVVREVRNMMDRSKDLYGLLEILDPVLGLGNRLPGFEKFVELALRCVEESGINRPAMSEVVKDIESIMQLAGMKLNSDSVSNSMTSLGTSRSPGHPYGNLIFDYSGTAPSSRLEPK